MDIFRVLTRGAAINKNVAGVSKGNSVDYSKVDETKIESSERQEHRMTKELDFFRNKKIIHKVNDLKKKDSDNVNDNSDDEKNKDKNEDDDVTEDNDIGPKITTKKEAVTLRKSYKGNITGEDIPLPIGSFEDLITRFSFDKRLLNNLIENQFTEPTPIQCEGIPMTLKNRDILACAPTGSGKTLAFLIPLLQQIINDKETIGLKGLIISPTKELANQIFIESIKLASRIYLDKKRPLQIALLSKSLSMKLKNKIISDKKYDLIISTPLRLIDVMKSESLDLSNLKNIIFDEADKLFDKTFVEQSDAILGLCNTKNLRKSMFSATIPSSVEEIANSIMLDPIRIIIGHKEAANSNIEQKLVYCGNEEGKLIAIRQLVQEGEFKPPIIIFLESITRAKALYHELMYDKMNVDVIHAERTPTQREKIIERFKSGELWCLICTDVLARGIDFKGVNLVINYDVPRTAQAYVHRIGRTGRGGRSGKAITLYTKLDSIAIKPIINVMKQSGCEVSEWMDKISKLTKKEKQQLKRGKGKDERKQISTVPRVDRLKRARKQEMIEGSKRRMYKEAHKETEVSEQD
ncbi:similar to Saccharomyces cerevisiae YGL171W ROK1 ATP-dependent RNA helicase of the DEAD box family [Maudiozyma barnettii]|uniref:ATP-dependent RNA helicase ROK1 n=1 Tax=Maudiozyma barnettii TaxID=61262 RepID=A0A8H2VF06_9SACH|nr:RNA-dependent ATPase ROK1 [Kazachstania barnettii]CAB4254360.1 similar to Saccharomyces cerevisiae YGL171W ROK1 ATP-dependent RNA helicase of the DEAD box family [Kazachstania barnettii]CAD1782231.1 similar to Saccharomyces cerevisiae YGL171W ROK1 ATP-dependent RNA helicase of the DEAD box family [Kazachstania barnettii]